MGDALVDLTFTAEDLNLRQPDGNFKVTVSGTVTGERIEGSVEGKKSPQGYRVKTDLSKGGKKALQVDSKVKADPSQKSYSTKTVYSVMGGIIQGTIVLKYEGGVLTFSNVDKNTKDKIEFKFDLKIGKSLYIEGKKNRNLLLPKFTVDVKLYKEGNQVVTLDIDTTVKPYKFLFVAPNVFKRWNVKYDKIEGTMDHVIGKSINIKTNIGGGIEIDGNRGDNSKGGRDINIVTKKGGKQMMKIAISTEKNVDDNEIRLVLRDSVEIDPDSLLYRKIVNNYRLLTPFTKRTGEFEIYVNKKERNVLLPKFSFKGEVKKDSETVMKALLTTNEKPYKMTLFLPVVLNRIYSDMDEYKVTVTHNPGQLLQVDTNGKKFKGFKIARTGSGNEREIVINGKKLGSGDYTLTDNSFSTKVTIADGNWIQPKVTWEGKLPSNKAEAEAFFLKK